MNLETTFAELNKLRPRRRGFDRSYSTFRDRTEKEFGSVIAENVEQAISGIFTAVLKRISGPLVLEDTVINFQKNGWSISGESNLVNELESYHDVASSRLQTH